MLSVLPIPLEKAIRAAASVSGVVLGQPRQDGASWAVPFTVDIGPNPDGDRGIFAITDWFAIVDATYPFGGIDVYPAKTRSLTTTFPHQNFNDVGAASVPWRTGKLCLDRRLNSFGHDTSNIDPVGNGEERLRWHLARTVQWLKAARLGTLATVGDTFELPHYPSNPRLRIVHDESSESFAMWRTLQDLPRWGRVVWSTLPVVEKNAVAVAYTNHNGTSLLRATGRYSVSEHGPGSKAQWQGVWWLWPVPVVAEPWRVPVTWGELRKLGTTLGVNVDKQLRSIARRVRSEKANVLLFGYPIPTRVGEAPSEIHWQAAQLPTLTAPSSQPRGGRPKEESWWLNDRRGGLADSQKIAYLQTSNWHPNRTQARGRLEQRLCAHASVIVGCGSIGSAMAELLVRGGGRDTVLIDDDRLAIGNLTRHMLAGSELQENKAKALAKKLASVAPFASVKAHPHRMPTAASELESVLGDREIIIDCTAADDVILALSKKWWPIPKLFVSVSVGYRARRTFVFVHRGHSFPYREFHAAMGPYLAEEKGRWTGEGETLEGAGCWSPLFPAKMADLLLAAASATKVVEEVASIESIEQRLIVFEQSESSSFSGLRRSESGG